MPNSPHGRGRGDGLEGLRQLRKDLQQAEQQGNRAPGASGAARRAPGAPSRGASSHRYRTFRRWPRRWLVGVNILVAAALIGSAGTYGYVQWRLDQFNRVKVSGLAKASGPMTVLVVGTDSRALGAGSGAKYGGTGNSGVQGQRSDSMILLRINPKYRSIGMLSVPRDTITQVPGYGTTRVNTAFNSGNPNLLIQVLHNGFGIDVNHYIEFNFNTFKDVSNAIGGVQQFFPTPAKDVWSQLNIPTAGCVNLQGDQALAFVRSRHYQYMDHGQWQTQQVPESDLGRIQRQQSFVRDALKKARTTAPGNPVAMNQLISGLTKNVTLDRGFSNKTILGLAQTFSKGGLAAEPSWTYPTQNITSGKNSGALQIDQAQAPQILQQWLNVGVPPGAPPEGQPAGKGKGKGKTPPPPTTLVNPSTVSVEVENGSGQSSQAEQASQGLQQAGYKATVNSNFRQYNYPTNTIQYAPDALNAAKQLQSQLNGGATLQANPSLSAGTYNLVFITGKNYSGLVGQPPPGGPTGGPAGGTSAPTTTAPAPTPASVAPDTGGTTPAPQVAPDASSYFNGVYIPPGLQPGQVPNTCGE